MDAARMMQPYLSDIALALVATSLVVLGDWLNRTLKRSVASWWFIARIAAFVLMCTFGYGLLTLWGQPIIYRVLSMTDPVWRPALILVCFCVLGVIAERKRYL
ncbi:DUF3392 domain-containing protein [Marinomonas ostreistagni]|uniref:DUF3392 domain-containing protein n=2 Tax=Marinomonas ostreistagni TaxID=359209 RepID=A0ABS0ZG00_9GAMM|nr:DUF3392 domain-containing protein [Marinomonas ostreistagni]